MVPICDPKCIHGECKESGNVPVCDCTQHYYGKDCGVHIPGTILCRNRACELVIINKLYFNYFFSVGELEEEVVLRGQTLH